MARPAGHRLNASAFDLVLNQVVGKSLTELAALAEIPRPTISALIGGHSKASPAMANRLARTMGVDVRVLFPTIAPEYEAAA